MAEIESVKWRRGYRGKVDAEKAFTALETIKQNNGGKLTAGIVLIEAAKKRNPLHKAFEWDDSKAAEEYRLDQARRMVGSIEVVYKKAPHVSPQRHYVAVTEPAKQEQPERKVYRSTAEALEDPVARDELLGNALREAITFRRKYAALSELAGVFHAIDDLVATAK